MVMNGTTKSKNKKELDILPLISKGMDGHDGQRYLFCPICKGEYNHVHAPYLKDGGDNYEAKWNGRGDLVVIPMSGECCSEWEVCIGFHKGNSSIFARINKSCKDKV